MILVDRQISQLVSDNQLGITNFDPAQVEPATYDLRIGEKVLDPEHPEQPIDVSANGGSFRLPPYGNVVLETYENLSLPPNIAGRIGLKSGFARRGIMASTGPQIDPGFKGKLFVSLFNMTAASHILSFLEPFLTIEFHLLEEQPDRPYEGPYQDKYSPSPDILEALSHLEGVTLHQMQTRFTELLQRIDTWSTQMSRIDEFLRVMQGQTEAINRLVALSEGENLPSAGVLRELSLEEAIAETLKLFQSKGRLTYSEIVEALHLDLETVLAACDQLLERGLIEEDAFTVKEGSNET